MSDESEASYMESIEWGEYAMTCEDEQETTNCRASKTCDRLSDEDLLTRARECLSTGKYNARFYDTAIKIIGDGNVFTQKQRNCLRGFIRIY